MSFERLPEMAADYGPDTQFLIGGALLNDSANLEASTRRFLDAILAQFPQANHRKPSGNWASACELPMPQAARKILEHLQFRSDFTWQGRDSTAYKPDDRLPIRDVARTELIGAFGESTAFDVRYFEIAPGGYSSREKHVHAHVVIGVRGSGMLDTGDVSQTIAPWDLAYVPSLRPHQLHNTGNEPFGFLCIVDHERDRPQPA
jgi:ribulose-bisphosphate carboxylase large chain